MKPPQVETIVDWHQDLSYYPLTNRDSVAVLLYLDDADEENGALRVVPREQSRADAMLDHASEDGFFQGRIPTYVRPRHAVYSQRQRLMRGGLCAAGLAGRRRQPARPADLGSACGLGDLPWRTHTPRLCTTTLLTAVLDLLLASNVRAEPLCLKT